MNATFLTMYHKTFKDIDNVFNPTLKHDAHRRNYNHHVSSTSISYRGRILTFGFGSLPGGERPKLTLFI